MADEAPELLIRFRRWKFAANFAPFVAGLALSAFLAPEKWRDGAPWSYAFVGVFAVFLVYGLTGLANHSYLRLTPAGLTVGGFFGRRTQYLWDEVSNFRVQSRLPIFRGIVFDLADHSPHKTTLRQINAETRGYDVVVSAMFERTAWELSFLLEEWHLRYGDRSMQPDSESTVSDPRLLP